MTDMTMLKQDNPNQQFA